MTHRLCIIGNSHVAAFATGWKEIASAWPGVEVTFFAARGARLRDLVVRNGALRAKNDAVRQSLEWTSGGRGEIVAADYDAFWLIGLRFGVRMIMDAYETAWSESHAPDPGRAPISDAAFARAAEGLLRGTVAVKLHDQLRAITTAPIHLFPQPNPSVEGLDIADPGVEPFQRALRLGDAPAVWRQYLDARNAVAAERGLVFRDQPDDSRVHDIFTSDAFGRGSVRLSEGLSEEHGETDFKHMNAAYGAMMLERNLPPTARAVANDHDEREEHAGIAVEGAGRT